MVSGYRLEAEYNFGTYAFFPLHLCSENTCVLNGYFCSSCMVMAGGGDASGYIFILGYPFYIRGYEGQTFTNGKN